MGLCLKCIYVYPDLCPGVLLYNEVALEQYKKLLDDQEEMLKKMGAALDDTFTKLMARDQDIDKEFTSMQTLCHELKFYSPRSSNFALRFAT